VNRALWAVVDVSAALQRLLTSDRPLVLYNLRHPDGYIALPISTTKIFIAANDKRTLSQLREVKPKDLVQRVNVFTVSRARRYVYALDRTQDTS
jgi:hypothetical protein